MPRGQPPKELYKARQDKLMATSEANSKERRRAVDMMNAHNAEQGQMHKNRVAKLKANPMKVEDAPYYPGVKNPKYKLKSGSRWSRG